MNRPENLEHELTAWFNDTAAPRLPDFTDDILRRTAGTRQRPRWTFPERWIPMSVITLGRRTLKPLPWRTIGLLAALALLIAAALAVYVGSRTRLPAPFGLARNGLVAYVNGGDIYTVDPITGARQAIVSGPDSDVEPRWSLDGTRLVFDRQSATGDALVVVDPKRPDSLVATQIFTLLDTDSIAWSPDGQSIVVRAQHDGSSAVFIVDAATGKATLLPLDVTPIAILYWRPPDGRQLMMLGGVETDPRLYLLRIDGGSLEEVTIPKAPGPIRLNGWTPDGQRFIYQRGEYEQLPMVTHVLDMATRDEVLIDAGYGHVSNDGTRMVAIDDRGRMCVAKLGAAEPCIQVGQLSQEYNGQNDAGVQWSPNDEWIITRPPFDEGTASLVDPDGAFLEQPSWLGDGGESWQRLAP